MSKVHISVTFFCALSLYAQNPVSKFSETNNVLAINSKLKNTDLRIDSGNLLFTTSNDEVAKIKAQDHTLAPNSYIFYNKGVLPDGKRADGLYIPVAKAYQMWEKGRYMQNDAGSYTPISETGQQTAVVFWEDVNGLISSTSIEGTGELAKIKVIVDKTKGEGNASIAFKVDGVIYWTWHIWVTDNPEDGASFGQGFETNALNQAFSVKYMDRNLGATNASFLGNDWHKSGGLMYQWGRKDPVPPLEYKDGSFYEVTGDVGSRRHAYAT